MSLKKRVYSMLVVSSSENFYSAISPMLPAQEIAPVSFANSISSAKREIAQRAYDFIIINAPLSDDIGLNFAIDCSASKGAIVLLLIRNEVHGEVYEKVFEHGVFTLPKPMSPQDMKNALRWMKSAKERMKGFEQKATSVDDKMQEIRLVNKAKWLLISNENMSEEEAHKHIEKEAMNRCISKKELSQKIINKYN